MKCYFCLFLLMIVCDVFLLFGLVKFENDVGEWLMVLIDEGGGKDGGLKKIRNNWFLLIGESEIMMVEDEWWMEIWVRSLWVC